MVCASGTGVCGVLVLVEDVVDLGLDLIHNSGHFVCMLFVVLGIKLGCWLGSVARRWLSVVSGGCLVV